MGHARVQASRPLRSRQSRKYGRRDEDRCMSPLLFSVFPRLLDQNESARLMWHTYCHSEKVEVGTFLEAVTLFMREQLHMPVEDVEAVLTEDHKAALVAAVDGDGNGKVCAVLRAVAVVVVAGPACSAWRSVSVLRCVSQCVPWPYPTRCP